MEKLNCWEYRKCGREPGGHNAYEFGVCPAAKEESLDGTNCGKNGGRACWPVEGTLCCGKVHASYAQKIISCVKCDFFQKVAQEEGANLEDSKEIFKKMRHFATQNI